MTIRYKCKIVISSNKLFLFYFSVKTKKMKLLLINFLILVFCFHNLGAQTLKFADESDLLIPEPGAQQIEYEISANITFPSHLANLRGYVHFAYRDGARGTGDDNPGRSLYRSPEFTSGGSQAITGKILLTDYDAHSPQSELYAFWIETKYEGTSAGTGMRVATPITRRIRLEGVPGCHITTQQTICGDQCAASDYYIRTIIGSKDQPWIFGGLGKISYEWERSSDGIDWISCQVYTQDLKPLSSYAKVFYRRITKNTFNMVGLNKLEVKTSNIVTVMIGTLPNITYSGTLTGCGRQGSVAMKSPFRNNNQWYVSNYGGHWAISDFNGDANNGSFSGGTSQTLLLGSPTTNQNGQYYVKNTTYGCNYTSNSLTLAKLRNAPPKPIVTREVINNETYLKIPSTYGYILWGQYYAPNNFWYHLPGQTTTSLKITEPGYYRVKVTSDQCLPEYSDQVELSYNPYYIVGTYWEGHDKYKPGVNNPFIREDLEGTSDLFNSNMISLSPNPASSSLNISLPIDIPAQVQIFSSTGTLVKEMTTSANRTQLDISDLPAGMYLVNIIQDGESTKHKVQVVK